ncbi:MAG: amidohydrolase family protein [Nitrospirae bacterium]|nr:amidohydrolase family protein [Nitrospirota bacterium]
MKQKEKIRICKVRGILRSDVIDLSAQLLSIRSGIIWSFSAEQNPGSGIEIEDFGQCIIAPLFCDYHLHFSRESAGQPEDAGKQLLRHGIGRAFEGGDKACHGLAVRDMRKGRPEIRSAGYAIFKKGGYGTAIGRGVDGVEEAFMMIDELHDLSVDYIKVIHSGLYEPDSGQISAGGFEAAELMRIVDYARGKGLDVYCHANGEKAVKEAVDAGVAAIVHGLYTSDEAFAEMAEKNVAFIPTVHAFQCLHAIAKTDAARKNIDKTVDAHLSAVSRAFNHRVRLLPGSDSGPKFIPYGSAYIEELRLFLRAGIPFEEVIRSSAASVLTEGVPADFVLLDGLSVAHVVIRGRFLQ